jgi:hypothetical protein
MDAPAPFSITQLLYEEGSFGVFVLVTVILGGGASALAGRAIAQTWRPWWQIIAYMLILGGVVRFFHFSLFSGTLLSLHYYLVDSAVCMLAGFAGYQAARKAQMLNQYRWINEPAGPMRWRRKPP